MSILSKRKYLCPNCMSFIYAKQRTSMGWRCATCDSTGANTHLFSIKNPDREGHINHLPCKILISKLNRPFADDVKLGGVLLLTNSSESAVATEMSNSGVLNVPHFELGPEDTYLEAKTKIVNVYELAGFNLKHVSLHDIAVSIDDDEKIERIVLLFKVSSDAAFNSVIEGGLTNLSVEDALSLENVSINGKHIIAKYLK